MYQTVFSDYICNGQPCYLESIKRTRICKPSYVGVNKDYLSIDPVLNLTALVLIIAVSVGSLIGLGMVEKVIYKHLPVLPSSHSIINADKMAVIVASIFYIAPLVYLCQHNFQRNNFCLINNDPICAEVDVSCFSLAKSSEFITAVDMDTGGFIQMRHTGHS